VQVLGLRQQQSDFATDCATVNDEDPNVMVIRRRRLTFVDERILFLPLPLKESCRDKVCGEEETCIGGACAPMDVPPDSLPDYEQNLLFGDTNTCFDPSACLESLGPLPLPVLLEQAEDCTFRVALPGQLPVPAPGELNVRVHYDSFGTEVLDLDGHGASPAEAEGFGFTDPQDALRFKLAPNLCESNYKQDRILALEASTRCASKRALQPLCSPRESTDAGAASTGGSGGTARAPLCTVDALRPVESAALVLLDNSNSMFGFYGTGAEGLALLVGLPLGNPVARRTHVALGVLPAAADDCGGNTFASRVAFGLAPAVRDDVGAFLQAPGSVLPGDPPLYLGAALGGAYRALAELAPAGSSRFNRKALVIVSNRDLESGLCPGQTNAERAGAALAGPDAIATYAVALADGEKNAVESARALASAGGTRLFDGVGDETEGAKAVQTILTELGTCLYQPATLAAGEVPLAAKVSYLGSAYRPVDIARNPACLDGSSASGWNLDQGLIRVCGLACETLREHVDTVALGHALEQRAAPPVPLVLTAPCE
jgi:hypothetical protein